MAIKLDDVLATAKEAEPELEPARVQRLVLKLIAACGLEVARNGEVFNPAEGASRMSRPRTQWSAPADNSRRRFRR
jgi:hypothetical protein